jgi:hypothetical protein
VIQKLNPGIFLNQDEEYVPKKTLNGYCIEEDEFHIQQFTELFANDQIDMKKLRELAWKGTPPSTFAHI